MARQQISLMSDKCVLGDFKKHYNKQKNKFELYKKNGLLASYTSNDKNNCKFTLTDVLYFVPPTIDISHFNFSETYTPDSAYFWQHPCCTELKAYITHTQIPLTTNLNKETKTIDTYLGIPWATFIDRKEFIGEIVYNIQYIIQTLKTLVKSVGYTLKVHTVCQSIHWLRYLEYFAHIGVTDVHACHYEDQVLKKHNTHLLKFHSWPLYAVNIEDSNRSTGITFNGEKLLLASFKGAHMVHYISDVRLLLNKALIRSTKKQDLFVEVTDEWHFNPAVFGQQVQNKQIVNSKEDDIEPYNRLLCESIFSLCPEGAGINTIRLWESLAVGSIPVLILSKFHVPMLFRLHPELYKCCVVVYRDNVLDIFSYLRKIPQDVILQKQSLCMKVYSEIKEQTTFQNQYNTLFEIY
jgi:hypothetical protein